MVTVLIPNHRPHGWTWAGENLWVDTARIHISATHADISMSSSLFLMQEVRNKHSVNYYLHRAVLQYVKCIGIYHSTWIYQLKDNALHSVVGYWTIMYVKNSVAYNNVGNQSSCFYLDRSFLKAGFGWWLPKCTVFALQKYVPMFI